MNWKNFITTFLILSLLILFIALTISFTKKYELNIYDSDEISKIILKKDNREIIVNKKRKINKMSSILKEAPIRKINLDKLVNKNSNIKIILISLNGEKTTLQAFKYKNKYYIKQDSIDYLMSEKSYNKIHSF